MGLCREIVYTGGINHRTTTNLKLKKTYLKHELQKQNHAIYSTIVHSIN